MRLAGEAIEPEDFHQIEILAMCITTYSELVAFWNFHLDHRRFFADNVVHSAQDLEDKASVDRLAILEARDHIINEFLCHTVLQSDAIVLVVHSEAFDI